MMIEDDDRLFFSGGEAHLIPKNKRESKAQLSPEGLQQEVIEDVGPFSVGDFLGKGGFGEVREGTNLLTGESVALKFLKRSDMQSMDAVERTVNEIHCLTTLKHRNIIKLQMVIKLSSKPFNPMMKTFLLSKYLDLSKIFFKRKLEKIYVFSLFSNFKKRTVRFT